MVLFIGLLMSSVFRFHRISISQFWFLLDSASFYIALQLVVGKECYHNSIYFSLCRCAFKIMESLFKTTKYWNNFYFGCSIFLQLMVPLSIHDGWVVGIISFLFYFKCLRVFSVHFVFVWFGFHALVHSLNYAVLLYFSCRYSLHCWLLHYRYFFFLSVFCLLFFHLATWFRYFFYILERKKAKKF